MENNIYIVSGTLQAENSFGEKLQNDFSVKITLTEDLEGYASYENLKIE